MRTNLDSADQVLGVFLHEVELLVDAATSNESMGASGGDSWCSRGSGGEQAQDSEERDGGLHFDWEIKEEGKNYCVD